MINFQMIDEFRRRTNSSYDEAKYYLERHNGDLLEAIIAFEKERTGCRQGFRHHGAARPHSGKFANGLKRVVQKLLDIKVVITDKNFRAFPIPVLIPIVLFPIWHVIIIMAIALMIMGFKFNIREMPDPNMNVESFISKIKDKGRESKSI